MRHTDTTHPRLDAYFDGEATSEEARAIEAHLAACLPCRRAVAEAHLLAEALSGPEPPLPPGFPVRVRERAVGNRLPAAPLWWLFLPPVWRAGVAAAFVLAILTGSWLGRTLAPKPTLEAELVAVFNAPETTAMLAVPDTNRGGSEVRP